MENGAPDSNKTPLWKRLLPIVIGVGIMVFLFGWVLPQFIDYEAVFRAIGTISALEWVLLIAVALLRIVPEGWVYMAAQPGLSLGQGIRLFLVSETLTNIPPGGLDMVARFQMSKSWGFATSEATSATIASWVFTTLSKLILPIAAVLFLAINRVQDDDLDLLAIIAFALVVVGGFGLYLVLRSPNLAGRVGDLLGRIVHRVSGIFRKEVHTDFRTLVLEFRDQASELLRKQTPIGTLAGVTARLASFAVLLMALRFVGIGSDQLHWTVAFGTYAVTMALTVIPIFNMPGIAEAILIATFNSAVGGGAADQVAAAVFVYRILTWLTPIPFGGLAFTRWRDEVRATGKTELLDAFDDSDAAPEGA
jgi:uncharacterized membrane protein YbhN (UPF0104 family)